MNILKKSQKTLQLWVLFLFSNLFFYFKILSIFKIENNLKPRNYKFGILNLRKGQTLENDIYANKHEESSKEYLDFLDLIGTKIVLEYLFYKFLYSVLFLFLKK